MSCVDIPSFEQDIKSADVVFEGHFVEYGMVKVYLDKPDHNFNFNKPHYYSLTSTFMADKPFKGIEKGERIETASPWPIPPEGKKEVLRGMIAANHYKNSMIFALTKIKYDPSEKYAEPVKDPQQFNDYYYEPYCGGKYDITAENIKVIKKTFPQAAEQ